MFSRVFLFFASAALLMAAAAPVPAFVQHWDQPHADCSFDGAQCCDIMNDYCVAQLDHFCSEGPEPGKLYSDADKNGCGCTYIEL